MRKAPLSDLDSSNERSTTGSWLDLETMATAELSSEDPQHPFENALQSTSKDGWKASAPGPQRIRLRFDTPQTVRRIHLHFVEEQIERSQEIALFASMEGSLRKELLRQQWGFSPHGATTEIENYAVELDNVTAIELEIDPGRHDKQVFATLQLIQIG